MKIYAIPPSLYCAKLRILLRHKALEWEEVLPPGGYGSQEYRAVVPAGNLPALIDGELLLADSEAIAEYLNETHPAPPMLPDEPSARALVRERSRYHDTRLEPAVRAFFPFIGPGRPGDIELEPIRDALADRLAGLEHLLAKAPPEKMLTLGDCGFPVTLFWLELLLPELGLGLDLPKRVRKYSDDLYAYPAVATEMASYKEVLRDWFAQRAGR